MKTGQTMRMSDDKCDPISEKRDPEAVKRILQEMPEEVREEFLSGDWMFGRGCADMKGGLAIGMALLEWYGRVVTEKNGIMGPEIFCLFLYRMRKDILPVCEVLYRF